MESAAVTIFQSSLGVASSSLTSRSGSSAAVNGPISVKFGAKLGPSLKHSASASQLRPGQWKGVRGSRRSTGVRASLSPESAGSSAPIAPLKLESPIGQFLSQILVSHPHLLPAAVEKQLEQLQTDRDAENTKEESSAAGTDLVLYRRIAEVKANERRKALEEILYALVVQKFMDSDVSLIPSVSSSSDPSGRVDMWPSQEGKLERLHSPEAYEMIQNHLALILGNRAGGSSSVAQISKLRVGQVYAASVMYGYFLRRVDQRFQLEKTMKILPGGSDGDEFNVQQTVGEEKNAGSVGDSLESMQSHPEVSSWAGGISSDGFGYGMKPSRLRTYVMSFDGETLQRYATIRSKEAVSIIEKHTEALFGRPEIVITPEGTVDSSRDELIKISFGGLKRLVLEAVTFGSFLWDVESYVDSRYHFVLN
ncbi:UV-B-induced protein At3g17800, chloroplastic-like [Punica granatum]|uniref:UV-B-induced protein At3g17800, chloroplastic-like n=2 Tax=Punica granatum TaxID=22663 RepID=A0A6P8EGN0_PUNGR|nr:UV-B-induced protein At3g17800, chloroplastic-like [Punica granatum]